MKAAKRKVFNSMPEHEALHEVERQCCDVMNAVLAIGQLHALRDVITLKDCEEVVEAAKRLMDKAKAAHARFETHMH
jgi:hypothetical protein